MTDTTIGEQLYRLLSRGTATELELFLRSNPSLVLNRAPPEPFVTPIIMCINRDRMDRLDVLLRLIREDPTQRLSSPDAVVLTKENVWWPMQNARYETFEYLARCPEAQKWFGDCDHQTGEWCLLDDLCYSHRRSGPHFKEKKILSVLVQQGERILKKIQYDRLLEFIDHSGKNHLLPEINRYRLSLTLLQAYLPGKTNRLVSLVPKDVVRKLQLYLFK